MNEPIDILQIAQDRYEAALSSWTTARDFNLLDCFPETVGELDMARSDLGSIRALAWELSAWTIGA